MYWFKNEADAESFAARFDLSFVLDTNGCWLIEVPRSLKADADRYFIMMRRVVPAAAAESTEDLLKTRDILKDIVGGKSK